MDPCSDTDVENRRSEPALPDTSRSRLPAADRRQLILEAATAEFAAEGYDRATLRAIARAASITTPILYRHFGSKVDLHRAVVEHAGRTLISVWASTPPSAEVEAMFLAATRPLFAWISSHRAEWSVLFVDQPADPAAQVSLAAVRTEADAAMRHLLDHLPIAVPEGMSADVFRDALSCQVTATGNALAAWWWQHRDLPADAITAMNHALVWRGLAGLTENV